MQFKVGDKVKVTKHFLSKLPHLIDRVKDGGIILNVFDDEAKIKFCSGYTPHIYLSSLELINKPNTQLLFNFMD